MPAAPLWVAPCLSVSHFPTMCICCSQGPGLPRRSSTLYPVGPHRYVWTAVAPVEELTDKGVDVSGLRTHGHMGLERGVQQAGMSWVVV